VIELAPAVRIDVVIVATPPTSSAVPSDVVPLKNCTVSLGVPVPGLTALTVAVRITFCPTTGEFGKEVIAVVVDARPTVTVTGAEPLVVKLVSPE
jgi:hypothetical protein